MMQPDFRGPLKAVIFDWAGTVDELASAGGHGVIDRVADFLPVLDDIEIHLARGHGPGVLDPALGGLVPAWTSRADLSSS